MTWSTWFAAAAVPLLLTGSGPARPAGAGESDPPRAQIAGWAVPPVSGRVLRTFDPPATRFGAGHRGVDLQAGAGQPVVAVLGGTVTFAGMVAGRSWITVDHGGGLDTTYGPVDPRLVRAGEVVAPGEWLGFVAAGAAHLDWGARLDDAYIDPLTLLGRWETYLTTSDDDTDLPAFGGLGPVAASAAPAQGGLVWPAEGPSTSGFGLRVHPITGAMRLHAGLDIGAPSGRPVRAAAEGVVSFAGTLSGYGSTVTIDHGGGISTLYAHQSLLGVRTGEAVSAGETIGQVGSTGLATGPHLHFEVRVAGRAVDPAGWLP